MPDGEQPPKAGVNGGPGALPPGHAGHVTIYIAVDDVGLRESHGHALAVSDAAAVDAMHDLHRHEGIDATEEGGATLAVLRSLLTSGVELPAPIVLFNTATSLKYAPRAAGG